MNLYYDYVLNEGVTKESDIKADFVDIIPKSAFNGSAPPTEMVKLCKKHFWFIEEFTLLSFQEPYVVIESEKMYQPFLANLVGISDRTLRDYETDDENLPKLEINIGILFCFKS